MTDLHVRVATPEDVEIWRALRLEGMRAYPSGFIVTEEEAAAVPIDEDARRLGRGDRLLAFAGDKAVGLAGFNRNPVPRARHRAEVGPLYVAPEAWGTGVSDRLMTTLIERAGSAGIWQLELFVYAENSHAIALYERHGFVRAGSIPNAIHGADGMEDDLMMIRTLAPD